jgi:UDP-2,3-diacylglucosamine pyrophosphatase LpxH
VSECGITYVMGNHDRAFHNFESLRESVRRCLPRIPVEFAGSFRSEPYGVVARHGHEWDDACNARLLLQHVLQRRRRWDPLDPAIHPVMAIGEVITAELMSGLVHRVRQTGNATLAELIQGLDNLRPATAMFQWLEWQARRRALAVPDQRLLCAALRESLRAVTQSALGRLWDRIQADVLVSADVVDRLQQVEAVLKLKGLAGLEAAVRLMAPFARLKNRLIPGEDGDYRGARVEFGRLDARYQFLVQGHTHRATHRYLAANADGRVRLYLNTGTYLPLMEKTDDGDGFASSHQMTMAFFYREDEAGAAPRGSGPTLDWWNGIKRKAADARGGG